MAFVGPLDSFNSQPIQTKVGISQTNIFTATSTKVTKDTSGKVTGGKTTLYYSATAGNYAPAATTIDGGKTWTYLNDSNGKPILGADAQKSLKQGALKTNTQEQIKSATTKPLGGGLTPEEQKVVASSTQNNATTTEKGPEQGGAQTKEGSAAVESENKYKSGTRLSYGEDLKYPLNLKSEVQDVIKFSILEYSPSLAKQNQSTQFGSIKKRIVTLESSGIPIVTGSKRIGVITLPIPAGISDGNTVGWEGDQLNMLQSEAANFAKGLFEGGVEGGTNAIEGTENRGKNAAGGDLQTAVRGIFLDKAISGSNVSGRAYGAVANNNLELLFSNPNLRSFSFQFSFYPRGKNEAVMVRRIIRAFKQSMSVKRSDTSLLLKAPHTFAISYVTAGAKAQPYLNKFKECALTSCSVDYTPDGTYMTYGGEEKSMTAYRLNLMFQELEPIFDDEYGLDDSNIGF